jgi:hypothetical protein
MESVTLKSTEFSLQCLERDRDRLERVVGERETERDEGCPITQTQSPWGAPHTSSSKSRTSRPGCPEARDVLGAIQPVDAFLSVRERGRVAWQRGELWHGRASSFQLRPAMKNITVPSETERGGGGRKEGRKEDRHWCGPH